MNKLVVSTKLLLDVLIALHAEQPTRSETLDTNAWARCVRRTIAAIRPCVAQPRIHLADAIPIQWLGLGDYAVGLSGATTIHICKIRAFTVTVAWIVLCVDASTCMVICMCRCIYIIVCPHHYPP